MNAFDDWYEERLTRYAFNAGLEEAAKEVLKVGGPGYEYLAASIRALKGETT